MGFVLTAVSVPGMLALAASWTFALVVLLARPGRAQNRLLAALLFLEGVLMGTGAGLMWATDDAATAIAWQKLTLLSLLPMPFVYLAFLGTTGGPLAKPFAGPGVRRALVLAAVAATLLWVVLRPTRCVTEPFGYAPFEVACEDGAGLRPFGLATAATFLFGLAVTLTAWRAARTPSARARGRALLTAFGVRDGLLGLLFAVVTLTPYQPPPLLFAVGPPLVTLAYVPLLAYGILRTQLFDIDLRIKWTLRRGTLVGAFVAAFFVAFAIAEQWLAQYGVLVGGVAAGLLLTLLRPLERAVDRLADAAMPRVRESAEYVAFRKLEVYKAALEAATQDGEVTPRERAVLDRLRGSLGIAEADARALERDLAERPALG